MTSCGAKITGLLLGGLWGTAKVKYSPETNADAPNELVAFTPFLPLHASVYARMLGERIAKHRARVWLVNTGWTGGAFGTGARMKLVNNFGVAATSAKVHNLIKSTHFELEPEFANCWLEEA